MTPSINFVYWQETPVIQEKRSMPPEVLTSMKCRSKLIEVKVNNGENKNQTFNGPGRTGAEVNIKTTSRSIA
jgi:hypothetical protein